MSEPTVDVVTALLREQAPHLAGLPVRPPAGGGSSNWVYRLGDGLAVRLPRSEEYVDDLRNEVRWLPRLARELPVPVPDVVVAGVGCATFDRPWSVVSWVPGDVPPPTLGAGQQDNLARSLGAFLRALHAIDTDGVGPGPHWGYRCGEPVTERIDGWVEQAAAELADLYDPARVRQAWRLLRDVPPPSVDPCWVHTDVSAENILVASDGRLTGVIDFGCVGVGDPSIDLLYAWSLLDAPAREALRRAAGADEGTWSRARAWAFAGPGLLTLANYRRELPERAARLSRMVEAVAGEVGVALR